MSYNSRTISNRRLFTVLLALSLLTTYVDADENLLINPGFEEGTAGWQGRSCAFSLSATSRTDNYSGYASSRTDNWQGIKQSMLGKMIPGKTYTITAWMMLENAVRDTIIATFEQRDARGVNYIRVRESTGYNDRWTQISGQFTLNVVGELIVLDVYFEGPDPGINFYLDDVQVLGEGISMTSATASYPAHDAIPVDANSATPLYWSPGEGAVLHEVYLGTDRFAVENATHLDATGLYRGVQDVNSYMPPESLESLETYYWRVDEVQADLATRTKGTVWRFTIGPEPPHLSTLAAAQGMYIGTAIKADKLGEPGYSDTLKREFNIITPENETKWASIHPQPDLYDFDDTDAIVDFAQSHGIAVHGHTLCWHSQNPAWLTEGRTTRTGMINRLRQHIHTVVGRYAGRIAVWDVVNEAVVNHGLRETFWHRLIGPDYIDMAFQFAHEADPNAILIINDYSIEPVNAKSTVLYHLVRDLLERQVPVHGVGMQMHLILKDVLDYQSFTENMRRFSDLGLQIYITEMDVRIREPITDASLADQAIIYANVLARCLEEPACLGFQTWGFTDKYSWIPGFFTGFNDALIFDRLYLPKPAYDALRDTFSLTDPNAPLEVSSL